MNEAAVSMFDAIKKRLSSYMDGRVYPSEIATTFNFILYDEFKKAGLKPVFVGQYIIDPKNPDQTRVFCHQGTEACSPIPIAKGVIGRCVCSGEDQFVPDVTKDPEHLGCDPGMEGTEVVLISWSDPYNEGEYAQKAVPVAVLDLDFNVKDTLTEEYVMQLREIWDEYGKMIFPGEAPFKPSENLAKK